MRCILFFVFAMAWTTRLEGMLTPAAAPPHPAVFRSSSNLMDIIFRGCKHIMQRHKSGQTEAFYHRMLEIHLYHHGVPCLKEVECFAMSGAVPVLVGRIDLEVDHTTILELKVGTKVLPKHVNQLMKYVRARQATGMRVQNAAVICFNEKNDIDVHNIQLDGQQSRFFKIRHECEDLDSFNRT